MALTAAGVAPKIAQCVALLAPVLVPAVHVLILEKFWSDSGLRVDKDRCACSCWDTVLKGPYETGVAGYKHTYLNATGNTFKIWALTVLCAIACYECAKHVAGLCLNNRMRYDMTFLFVLSTFSHYHSWWSFVNYWNDDCYSQWNHRLFVAITELYSTSVLYTVCDRKRAITRFHLFSIVSAGLTRTLAAVFVRFFVNVTGPSGLFAHRITIDLLSMIPGLLNIVIPLLELNGRKLSIISHYTADDPSSFKEMSLLVVIVVFGLIIVSLL